MALITCKNCGKKIRDTAKKCVHCGAQINKNEDIQVQENSTTHIGEEISTQEENEKILFQQLKNEEKTKLVKEFWKSDKQAYSYIVGNQISKKLNISFVLRYIPIMLFPLFFVNVLNLKPQSLKLIIFFYGITMSIIIIEIIISSVLKRKYEKKAKNYAYKKRFKIWLEENKNIIYYPIFLDKKEQRIFEEINIKKVKL